jgi:hypothetical protein
MFQIVYACLIQRLQASSRVILTTIKGGEGERREPEVACIPAEREIVGIIASIRVEPEGQLGTRTAVGLIFRLVDGVCPCYRVEGEIAVRSSAL